MKNNHLIQSLLACLSLATAFGMMVSASLTQELGAGAILIDNFNDTSANALGFFHGVSGAARFGEFEANNGGDYLKVATGDVDAAFITTLAEGCVDLTSRKDHYVHIEYSGSSKFSVSLQQHNRECDDARLPFPETWDSVQAARYSTRDGHGIYIPMSHFRVDFKRVIGFALESWYTNDTTLVYRIEIVPPAMVPAPMKKISKLATGRLNVGCIDPNNIAFGIDDGSPKYLQRMLQIIKDEEIPVTFFVQGIALELGADDGNFTAAYREMKTLGHQIGLHTLSHPRVESLQNEKEIDSQITRNMELVKEKLGVDTRYFRPPYGTIGARTRQGLARYIKDPEIVMWSIDVEDWVYGIQPGGDPLRRQFKSFSESLSKGGTIVVMHYLYESTVDQFRDMIRLAKAQGRQFVRADQCVGDPAAPQTWGWTRTVVA